MQLRTKTIERLRDALLQSGKRPSAVESSAFKTLARAGLLTEKERAAVTRVDAVAKTLFLVMAADEQIMDTEMDAMRGAIRGLTGDALGNGIIDVMVESYALRLHEQGKLARLREIASSIDDPDEAESAFSLAAAVAVADDDVADAETGVLKDLAAAFGFDAARVQRVLEQLADDAEP